ncbi:Crossover junction endodeoxyribonuclease RuvC [wastewater metagenome]|uniref:Crossover junction endodeoxyribonuclease RuvC n=2 Tax=unclassified sequences TaxID=12908 RepID=A0A5B8R8P0_9ZZZZ|nr:MULTISPECIES: crossover junction endodeoxyribonuclease RuvC [Arhodomonas]MCS4504177.1 crossover junction endodeoxyribonuclease RuvC [Arhodomonas aquaeolei]QEA04891.1 crossover junction endodeoxyribonuclease RuvC [uncultured organism]
MSGDGVCRVLGIDPGSRVTGFGIIDSHDRGLVYVASGVIRVEGQAFPVRLRAIFEQLGEVVERYQPAQTAIEQVFVRNNPDSALKLGQARGAAICACVGRGLPLAEYTASMVKQAVTGNGGAGKEQVQYMVRTLLGLQGRLREDASDALGVALCHIHRDRLAGRLAGRGRTA